jgi:hypothetical protein
MPVGVMPSSAGHLQIGQDHEPVPMVVSLSLPRMTGTETDSTAWPDCRSPGDHCCRYGKFLVLHSPTPDLLV